MLVILETVIRVFLDHRGFMNACFVVMHLYLTSTNHSTFRKSEYDYLTEEGSPIRTMSLCPLHRLITRSRNSHRRSFMLKWEQILKSSGKEIVNGFSIHAWLMSKVFSVFFCLFLMEPQTFLPSAQDGTVGYVCFTCHALRLCTEYK